MAEALQKRSPKLAGVYRTALELLASDAAPRCEAARISIICHCVRELMMGLPAVLSEFSIPRPVPPSGSLLKQLPRLLAKHPDADLGLDQDLVPVPRIVAQALASLISTAAQEEGRNRANTAALVTGGTHTTHPVIDQWLKTYNFFVDWAHLDRNHERQRTLPSDETLLANIRVVEDVIEVRSARFFENLHALEDLLAEINGVDEENA
ncbi:hypothetical protein GU243_08920 [Pseudarthrobacter psychrotolerans]|uniref:Uncharacterized protein n=1 Tax=Pseudarthrobacter psychrotolerans TaxID=2697569 RepID=A0A6P1NM03_9MICC|nr:hypothetical protein [Pseudarthrobacter psychrotolerans]QHK19837.1 hypothetical protein GU243_08920 [Pseudarthrobacter psychrotolerans]